MINQCNFDSVQFSVARKVTNILKLVLLLSSLQVSADGKPPIRRCSQISENELFYPTDPGAAPTCERCLKCTRGQGLTPQCGSRVPNGTKIKCIQCQANVSYSNSSGIESCQPCQECGLKNVIQDCSPKKNRICGTECPKGYFLDDNHICQECYFCCDSVSEAQRRQGCKKIGMDRDWQCEKTTQNQRCYGDRKKVINGQEKHGAASLGPVMGGVVSIIFIISAFVLVASRKRIRESFSRTNNTVTADSTELEPLSNYNSPATDSGRIPQVFAEETEAPNVENIPADCRVSEIEQLCNDKGEPMLFFVQRKLDVPGTQDRKSWRSLGHVMKVSSDDLDLIEVAYKAEKSPTEILLAKFKTFTPEPTMREFVQALIICQRNDVASYICNRQWE